MNRYVIRIHNRFGQCYVSRWFPGLSRIYRKDPKIKAFWNFIVYSYSPFSNHTNSRFAERTVDFLTEQMSEENLRKRQKDGK